MSRLRRGWSDFRETVMFKLLLRQKQWIGLLLLLVAVNLVVTILSTSTLRRVLDVAIVGNHRDLLGPLVRLIVVYAVLGFGLGWCQRLTTARIGYQIEYELRVWVYQRLVDADPRRLDSLATGQLITRAYSDLNLLERLTEILPTLLAGVVILLGLGTYMIVLSPPLALLALAALPINFAIAFRMRNRMYAATWLAINQRAEVTSAMDEPVRGIRVVKALGREEHANEQVAAKAGIAYGLKVGVARFLARFDMVMQIVPVLLNAALLVLGGWLLINGHVTIGSLLIILRFTRRFTGLASTFDELILAYQGARAGSNRVFELIALAKPPGKIDNPRRLPSSRGPNGPSNGHVGGPHAGLEFEDVGMAFGATAVFDGITFQVAPGRLVVLTGAPGSGKSVVAALAAAQMRPAVGQVTIDDVDVRSLDPQDLRHAVRLLDEQPFLFGRSVRDNLEIGARVAGDDGVAAGAMAAALWAAAADEIVAELPDGLDDQLGDRGLTLSGGQRQRLALARALMVPPRILVLDDALSAVDSAMEMEILRRIRIHAPGMGILHITRREGAEAVADDVVGLADRVDAKSPLARALATAVESGALGRSGPLGGITRAGADVDRADLATRFEGVSVINDLATAARIAKALPGLPDVSERPRISERQRTDERPPTMANVVGAFRGALIRVGLLVFALTALKLAPVGLHAVAIDALRNRDWTTSNKCALAILAIAAALAPAAYFTRIAQARMSEGIMYALRNRTIYRLTRLGIDYYDRELPGQVSSRVVYDLERVGNFTDAAFLRLTSDVTLILLAVGAAIVWEPSLWWIVVGFTVAMAAVSFIQLPIANRAVNHTRRRLGALTTRMQEDFAGRYVLNQYGAATTARDAFVDAAWEYRQAKRWALIVGNTYGEIVELLSKLAQAAVIDAAGYLVIGKELSLGGLSAVQAFVEAALEPIRAMAGLVQAYVFARVSFRKLGDFFRAPRLPRERTDPVVCPPLAGRIDIENVRFRYPGTERYVLSDVSLTIEPGEVVAITGPTGAGKSSLAKLVGRVYDPDAGNVRVDGIDIREFDLRSYRRRMGVVPQEAFCFRGTIASNLAYGKPDATRDELRAAIRAIGGTDVLGGLALDARVEEEGRNLTSAQRTMIALVRVWLTQPDVLVFDEATNGLSSEVEADVLAAVRRLGCTTILVTHRPGVTGHVDRVIRVADGHIAEAARPAAR